MARTHATENLREAIRDILPEIVSDGVKYYREAILKYKIVNTGDLMNDITHSITEDAEGIIGHINFHEYGRYRDMGMLRWAGANPPIDELEKWVLAKGVGSFAWVPGYEKSNSVPSESRAARRIASAIAYEFGRVDGVKKTYSKTTYNATIMKMVNVARVRVLNRVTEIITRNIVDELEMYSGTEWD